MTAPRALGRVVSLRHLLPPLRTTVHPSVLLVRGDFQDPGAATKLRRGGWCLRLCAERLYPLDTYPGALLDPRVSIGVMRAPIPTSLHIFFSFGSYE
jgi:hypothetical protein